MEGLISLNRYAKKRDVNEAEIVSVLRGFGLSVYLSDQPLDLICGYGGLTRLAEVKDAKNKRGEPKAFTKAQSEFLDDWQGNPVTPLVTVEDARQFALKMRRDAGIAKDKGFAA